MTYRITGLSPQPFVSLFELDGAQLAERNAERVTVTAKPGFPCRISLDDAEVGEDVILLHHVSHDVANPYRSAYAIYVRPNVEAVEFVDRVPPVMVGRPIALRGFDTNGRLNGATLAAAGAVDEAIRALFSRPEIAYIHAHNAAHGCFAAQVDRI